MGLQEQVLVIYSVAFRPSRRHPDDNKSWKWQLLLASLNNLRQWVGEWLGQLRCWIQRAPCTVSNHFANAWGRDAYGLRMAIVSASHLKLLKGSPTVMNFHQVVEEDEEL